MAQRATRLSKPIKRRLRATQGRRQRPWFVEVDPEGFVTVWPSRCRREALHVETIYQYGLRLRRERERLDRKRAKEK